MRLPLLVNEFLYQASLAGCVLFLGLFMFEWLIPGSVLPFFDVYQWLPALWLCVGIALACHVARERLWTVILIAVLPFLYDMRWTFEDVGGRWIAGTAWGLLLVVICFGLLQTRTVD